MFISLPARSIRIGSYKVMPTERVLIVPQGIRLKIPSVKGSTTEMIDIPLKSIVKVLWHLGKSLPVMILYLIPSLAENIRKILKMTDKDGMYYDPCSNDDVLKRIIILPEKFKDEEKIIIKEILTMGGNTGFSKAKLEELNLQEANEILIKSVPNDVKNVVARDSVRTETKTLLIYPPPPQKCGISITTDDYSCLEEEQFLNDVIIDFYLKYLMQKLLSDEHRRRTHVFSTFFYKRLTSKHKAGRRFNSIEDDPKLSPAEKRHARVKSWTKNVDIFEKDFIIIPINEHAHWFLAIICYPGLSGPVRVSDGMPLVSAVTEQPRRRRSTRARTRIEQMTIDDGEASDRDEASGDSDELDDDDDDDPDIPPSKKSKVEDDTEDGDQSKKDSSTSPGIKQPCILIFDSLTGANRVRIVATLRDYLTVEHRVRKQSEKTFNRETMKGACPRVPQQMNYSDCGIYTLQFAESFFEEPVKDYTFPIRSLCEWFSQEKVRGKREDIANLIKKLMIDHNPNHSSIMLPDITFSSEDKKEPGESQSGSENLPENSRNASEGHNEESPSLEDYPHTSGESKFDTSTSGKESKDGDSVGGKRQSNNTYLLNVSSKASLDKLPNSCDLKKTLVKNEHSRKNLSTSINPLIEKVTDVGKRCVVSLNRVLPGGVVRAIHSKNIQFNKITSASSTAVQEFPVSQCVDDLEDQLEFDETIFPQKNSTKRVVVQSNSSSVSGLAYIQSHYCDDEPESTEESSCKLNSNIGNSSVRKLSCTSGSPKVERVVYKGDKNGVNEHLINPIKSVKRNLGSVENRGRVINGTVETVLRGSSSSQMVPNSPFLQESHMQSTTNVTSVSSQRGTVTPVFSYQNSGGSRSTSSVVSPNITPASQYSNASQSQDMIENSLCVPSSSASRALENDSGVKTVESLGMTSIIDEDTDEVLLIMQASNNRQSADANEYLYMQDESEVSQCGPSDRLLSNVHSDDVSLPPRADSASPTCIGGSPSILRTTERITAVTSSGRTIARPKRFDDSYEDDIFPPKKTRSKTVPGKLRIVR
ncbi:Sentrin-specific protease 6 [Halocaridina rubra]|uniref:Sentrin-specific protease 6 n=1 Tax=Halocaridina rubra TaxID=373956 RepID=A0AAN8WR35_HALRR